MVYHFETYYFNFTSSHSVMYLLPNVRATRETREAGALVTMEFRALCDIPRDHQITLRYGVDWFAERGIARIPVGLPQHPARCAKPRVHAAHDASAERPMTEMSAAPIARQAVTNFVAASRCLPLAPSLSRATKRTHGEVPRVAKTPALLHLQVQRDSPFLYQLHVQ